MEVKTAVILAGGLGLRLRPLTDENPKVMIRILNKPIAHWQVEWLVSQRIEKIVFASGYLWHKIKEYFNSKDFGAKIDYSVEEEPLGTGGAIKKALKDLQDEDCLVLNGDIIITEKILDDMINWHKRLELPATILVVPFISPFGVLEVTPLGRIKRFIEKPKIPNTYINGGIYILKKKLVKSLPDKGDIEVTTFPELASKDLLGAYPYEGYWRSIDSIKDLKNVEKELGIK